MRSKRSAPWPSLTLKSWKHFQELAAGFRFGDPFTHSNLARGQADAEWRLESSLERLLSDGTSAEAALKIEASILRQFKSVSRHIVDPAVLPSDEPDNVVEWWCLMQHHGAPTRLLDWTVSPYVACYFAVATHWDKDGAIWLMHPYTMGEHVTKLVGGATPLDPLALKADSPHLVCGAVASRETDRMFAQQSAFTFGLNILTNHEVELEKVMSAEPEPSGSTWHGRLIVPKALKPDFLDQLHSMNVTASSLFPGVDGIGRRLHELARVAFARL